MLETLMEVKRRTANVRGLLLFALAAVALMVWLFTRSTEHLGDYTETRKQTWISPERIAYVNQMETKVQAVELELTDLATNLLRGAPKTKAARESKAAEIRQHGRTVRERLAAVKLATNDELEAAKAELERVIGEATAAATAAKPLVEAPPPAKE